MAEEGLCRYRPAILYPFAPVSGSVSIARMTVVLTAYRYVAYDIAWL